MDGSAGDIAGSREGGAVELGKGVMVDVDFTSHTERTMGFAGSSLGSNEAVAVGCGLLHWFMGHCLGFYTGLIIFEHPEQQASDVLGMLSMPHTNPTLRSNKGGPGTNTLRSSICHPLQSSWFA